MEGLTPDQRGGNGYEQASKSNDVSISIPEQASVEVKIEAGPAQMSFEPRIWKVPYFLRLEEEHNNYTSDYDPVVVSFGPYHHGKPELKFVEDFKPTALEIFAAGTGKDIDFLYNKVLEIINEVRRCYIENSTAEYDDAVFARMMLLDACLIICYIEFHVKEDFDIEAKLIQLGVLTHSLIIRDMYLLENQIPFWLLKLLIYLKYDKDEGEEILEKFLIRFTLYGDDEHIGGKSCTEDQEEPLHLLEAFRLTLIADCNEDEGTNRRSSSICRWLSLPSTATIGKACQYCPSKLPWIWKRKMDDQGCTLKKRTSTLNSVMDLKTKGIHFSPSPTDSIRDIKFRSSYLYGTVQLPTLLIGRNSRVFFLNMVAYELCPTKFTNLEVSSYINLMQSLIQSPKDVTELREKRIIFNRLGCDEKVMQMYHSINTHADNVDMFDKVRQKVLKHYDSKAKTCLAELIHTYFRSPWSAIALFAAGILLCLTFLQTYFAIHPSSN